MKIRYIVIYIVLLICLSIGGAYTIAYSNYNENEKTYVVDPVEANRLIQDIQDNWQVIKDLNQVFLSNDESTISKQIKAYDMTYAIIDLNENLLGYSKDDASISTNTSPNASMNTNTSINLSTSIADATRHGDVIRDISSDNQVVGHLIIHNPTRDEATNERKMIAKWFAFFCGANVVVILLYSQYIKRNIVDPFKKMKRFATSVSAGNLDVVLERDKNNIFGAFTESFDIMREELLLARQREADAKQSRKELVAELSHDIKTPVASIKAMSEVMMLSAGKEEEQILGSIIDKTDQIDGLVSNLFHATLEELEQLSVNLDDIESTAIRDCIVESDYKKRIESVSIPDCVVRGDYLRIQQVIGNIIFNSYKYADTEIEVNSRIDGKMLLIEIRDFGPGVPDDEIYLITQKFKRGSNSKDVKGSGLGLYIARYLCEKMQGSLIVENKDKGFSVIFGLMLS